VPRLFGDVHPHVSGRRRTSGRRRWHPTRAETLVEQLAALLRCSWRRTTAAAAGHRPSMPATRSVTIRWFPKRPLPVQRAIALVAPYSRSFGCSTTASACSQSSSIGGEVLVDSASSGDGCWE
jgi:hypothetical protein